MIDVYTARRASSLTDGEINALLDEYLFDHRPLCLGHSVPDALGVWRCTWCGYIDDRAVASRVFDAVFGHRREVPTYTPAEIVLKIEELPHTTQIVFATTVKALILGDSQSFRRSPMGEFMQTLFNVHHNARAVGIAALTALKVVDDQGYIKEGL